MQNFTKERIDYFSLNIPAIIYTCLATDNFPATYISKNIKRILGYTPGDFIRTPSFWIDRLHPDEVEGILVGLNALFENNEHHHIYRFRAANGDYKWFRDELTLIRNSDGEPEEIIGCMVDITVEKNLELHLAQLEESKRVLKMKEFELGIVNARLDERSKLLQDMHDGFGSQLASARVMAREGVLTPEGFERTITECLSDLHLVCDTLSLRNESIQDALIDFKFRLDRRLLGSSISVHWDINLNCAFKLEIRDILSVMRILQESISNALQHASATRITIKAECIYECSQLIFEITDNGIGIPAKLKRGRGLNNMYSRANSLGAILDISSLQSGGTQVLLQVNGPDSI